jgi:hypothetical protein
MKTKSNIIKGFDTVNFFRKVKEKISKEIYGMSNVQLKEYFKNSTKENYFKKYNELKDQKIN